MHEQLIKEISSRDKVQIRDIELTIRLFDPVFMPKNKVLEEIDQVPKFMYYVISGFLRQFYYNDNGEEVTTQINCCHPFFTVFSEFVNQSRSSVVIETITDCQLLRITKSDYDLLMDQSPFWKDYGLHILQESMAYHEQRSKDLATLTAEQRYLKLMSSQPAILHNVPLQYIASYLGIKPESLSRIRRNLIN